MHLLPQDKKTRTVVAPLRMFLELKSHQLNAVRFLWNLIIQPPKEELMGCIIAHTMGLGKTLTSIAFLLLVFQTHRKLQKVLVIGPKITVSNWVAEAKYWSRKLGGKLLKEDETLFSITDDVGKNDREDVLMKWKLAKSLPLMHDVKHHCVRHHNAPRPTAGPCSVMRWRWVVFSCLPNSIEHQRTSLNELDAKCSMHCPKRGQEQRS